MRSARVCEANSPDFALGSLCDAFEVSSRSRTVLKTRAGPRPLNLRLRKKMLQSQRLPDGSEADLAIRWCRGGKGGRNAQEVPVMRDYAETVKNFSAADLERRTLAGSLGGGVNACIECCDRWVKNGAIGLEWHGANGERRTLTFMEMRDRAGRVANYLQSKGIG